MTIAASSSSVRSAPMPPHFAEREAELWKQGSGPSPRSQWLEPAALGVGSAEGARARGPILPSGGDDANPQMQGRRCAGAGVRGPLGHAEPRGRETGSVPTLAQRPRVTSLLPPTILSLSDR